MVKRANSTIILRAKANSKSDFNMVQWPGHLSVVFIPGPSCPKPNNFPQFWKTIDEAPKKDLYGHYSFIDTDSDITILRYVWLSTERRTKTHSTQ